MTFETLHHKNIMMFGKSRALPADEFSKQLQLQEIELVSDEKSGVEVIVQGRMVNPVEQDHLDRLYEQKVAPIIEVDALEQWLCSKIDADNLLMSLKLSADRERLMGYLQNPFIDNALFLRLLNLYDWEGEGFFENDDNRDITAALISRFYENIERNHNVQYANMGLMHLLNQSKNSELAETIALLAPLQQALKNGCDNSTRKILNAIALHPSTTTRVLKQYLKNGNDDIQMLIAMRHDLNPALQQFLLNLKKPVIHEVLSLNSTLQHETNLILLEEFGENVAKHITLDSKLFETLEEKYALSLAQNGSLTEEMQKALFSKGVAVQKVLATNPHLEPSVFEALVELEDNDVLAAVIGNTLMTTSLINRLYARKNSALYEAIGGSPKTEASVLEALSQVSDIEVLKALARNPATPIDLLYQFQLDSRLSRAVKENESFGKHIQRDNIGWDV